jgi:hypothetical protein
MVSSRIDASSGARATCAGLEAAESYEVARAVRELAPDSPLACGVLGHDPTDELARARGPYGESNEEEATRDRGTGDSQGVGATELFRAVAKLLRNDSDTAELNDVRGVESDADALGGNPTAETERAREKEARADCWSVESSGRGWRRSSPSGSSSELTSGAMK